MGAGHDPLAALSGLRRDFGDDLPLDRGMIAIARVERPELQASHVLDELDRLALRTLSASAGAEDGGLDALRRVLFEEEGYRGHREKYYQPENSLIDRVLERRTGIPISLAVVWLEVARRMGSTAQGVGFPGHFLVRHLAGEVWHYVDVFDGGRVLTPGDPERLLTGLQGPKARLEPSMLEPVSARSLLMRVANNLKNAYALAQDAVGVVRSLDRLLALAPELQTERRDRGLVYARLGLPSAALADLKQYLEDRSVPAGERAAIERMLPSLEAGLRRMN